MQILDEDKLHRRVPFLDPNYIRDDGTLTSYAFTLRKGENGLSVNLAKCITYDKSISDKSKYRLYYLTAGYVQSIELLCVHDPQPDNFAHCLITGNITRSKSRKMAKAALLIRPGNDPH